MHKRRHLHTYAEHVSLFFFWACIVLIYTNSNCFRPKLRKKGREKDAPCSWFFSSTLHQICLVGVPNVYSLVRTGQHSTEKRQARQNFVRRLGDRKWMMSEDRVRYLFLVDGSMCTLLARSGAAGPFACISLGRRRSPKASAFQLGFVS